MQYLMLGCPLYDGRLAMGKGGGGRGRGEWGCNTSRMTSRLILSDRLAFHGRGEGNSIAAGHSLTRVFCDELTSHSEEKQ